MVAENLSNKSSFLFMAKRSMFLYYCIPQDCLVISFSISRAMQFKKKIYCSVFFNRWDSFMYLYMVASTRFKFFSLPKLDLLAFHLDNSVYHAYTCTVVWLLILLDTNSISSLFWEKDPGNSLSICCMFLWMISLVTSCLCALIIISSSCTLLVCLWSIWLLECSS